MILIADSGSTKTDWTLVDASQVEQLKPTQGINPVHQSREQVCGLLRNDLLSQLEGKEVSDVYFYGAGCTPAAVPLMKLYLQEVVGCNVSVGSDMLGAARALLGHEPGIACILGTGSNSCYYDGSVIMQNIPPLGYILGDEGSGAYIGKRLIGNVLKHQFSDGLCYKFFKETELDAANIINNVYRQPLPNRFLGQVSQFCHHHRDEEEMHQFLLDCFGEFFNRNIANYSHPELPVSFVGSIAWAYEDELKATASSLGYQIGKIVRSPMQGLIDFHRKM